MINKKRWRGKPTLARGKNPPPPSTNGCHYMTFVLENKIVEKDLPILGLDNLGLPEMGKNFLHEQKTFMHKNNNKE